MADEQDMRLAGGVGIIPEHQRGKAYEKLGIKPGEGGIRSVSGGHDETMGALHELAAALRETRSPRRTTKENPR